MPYLDNRISEINRKRALAQALLAQAQTPIEGRMAGRFYVPPSPLQGIAKMAQSYVANKDLSDLDAREKSENANYQKALADALAQKPSQPLPEGQQGPAVPARNPSYEEISSRLSGNPYTADMGFQMNLDNMKRQDSAEQRKAELEIQNMNKLEQQRQHDETLRLIASMNIAGRKDVAETNATGKGKKPTNLSPTAQKELFEADDIVMASQNAVGLLNRALELNDKAYSGPAAKARATVTSWLPGEAEGANASIDLDNLMTGQALETLRATFGGMPTEGERKVLLDMQASLDKQPSQRKEILDRAIKLVDRRLKINQNKAKALREGTYFGESPVPDEIPELSPTPASNNPTIDDLLKKY